MAMQITQVDQGAEFYDVLRVQCNDAGNMALSYHPDLCDPVTLDRVLAAIRVAVLSGVMYGANV